MEDIFMFLMTDLATHRDWIRLHECSKINKFSRSFAYRLFRERNKDLVEIVKSSVEREEHEAIAQLMLIDPIYIQNCKELKDAAVFAAPGACARLKPTILQILIKKFKVDLTRDSKLLTMCGERMLWNTNYVAGNEQNVKKMNSLYRILKSNSPLIMFEIIRQWCKSVSMRDLRSENTAFWYEWSPFWYELI